MPSYFIIHPGEILKEEFMLPRGISVTALANGLKMNRTNISHIINGHTGISPELAVKLSLAFDNSPEFWLNLQRNYDLRLAREKLKDITVTDFSKWKRTA